MAAPHRLWDLSSPSRDWTWAIAVKVQSPNQVISKVQLFRAVVSYLFKKFLQIYLFMAALGLHCMQALSSRGERGGYCLVAEHRLQSSRVGVARGFSCPRAGGIFLERGLNLCFGRRILNHWTAREVLS